MQDCAGEELGELTNIGCPKCDTLMYNNKEKIFWYCPKCQFYVDRGNALCPTCHARLLHESIDTYLTDSMGNELYEHVQVCPNGCDGYYSKPEKRVKKG